MKWKRSPKWITQERVCGGQSWVPNCPTPYAVGVSSPAVEPSLSASASGENRGQRQRRRPVPGSSQMAVELWASPKLSCRRPTSAAFSLSYCRHLPGVPQSGLPVSPEFRRPRVHGNIGVILSNREPHGWCSGIALMRGQERICPLPWH